MILTTLSNFILEFFGKLWKLQGHIIGICGTDYYSSYRPESITPDEFTVSLFIVLMLFGWWFTGIYTGLHVATIVKFLIVKFKKAVKL